MRREQRLQLTVIRSQHKASVIDLLIRKRFPKIENGREATIIPRKQAIGLLKVERTKIG
jgi:hypothetical protein